MKTLQNLNQADLEAIADALFLNNNWYHRNGQPVTAAQFRAELLGAAYDHAERCDKHNAPCKVGA